MEKDNQYLVALEEAHISTTKTLEKILASEETNSAFSEPVETKEYKVITASETVSMMGIGFGLGGGDKYDEDEDEAEEIKVEGTEEEEAVLVEEGLGGGTGSGARVSTRPVAVITLKPEGVEIEPIIDVNKIVMATMTAASFISFMVAKAIVGGKRRRK